MSSRFVCVINRNRDNYQVPLALQKAGLLECLVTDFYAPESLARWLPQILRRRRIDGLPLARVSPVYRSFAMQVAAILTRQPIAPVIARINRMHAARGAALSARTGAHLYCYGNYLPDPDEKPDAARIIDFEFHPHPALTRKLLVEDAALYPEVAISHREEIDALDRTAINNAWRQADAIVCASSMTRRSLEYAGCDPAKITVIPYGFTPRESMPPPRTSRTCEFLFVGQGIQRKGLHHLLRAWTRNPPPGSRLTIVAYRIDAGIAALAAHPTVRLLGYQDKPALDRIYSDSDVFVMPSLVEGFGLVYLEALAAGCHVIATTNTGIPDLSLDEDAATVIEPGDLEKLANAVHELARRKGAGLLDPVRIAAQAATRPWSTFRKEIADHAARFLKCYEP